jgi:predicted ester cyclase
VDTVAAGDKVAIRWTSHGTHQGDLLGIPPTGTKVQGHGIDIIHLRDGKIAEVWIEWDVFGTLQQLGMWPPQAAQASASG